MYEIRDTSEGNEIRGRINPLEDGIGPWVRPSYVLPRISYLVSRTSTPTRIGPHGSPSR